MEKKYEVLKKIAIDKNDLYYRRKEALSSFFSDNSYTLMTFKQIAKFFDVKSEEYILESILNELELEGVIYIDDSKRYALLKNSNVIKCIYEKKSAKFGFGLIEEEDIYISSNFSMGAMDKDEVLVKIIVENSNTTKSKEGKIIKVLKRNTSKVIGKFVKNENFGFVIPIDSKIDDIYISKKYSEKIKDDQMVEVEIIKYASQTSKSEGKIISVIGDMNTDNIEVKALYKSYDLDMLEKFNPLVEKELESISDKITFEDKIGRVDKTSERAVTIDSEDAKDLDDAVCVKKLDNSNYLLSVFIADVSNYVKDGTNLDKEAAKRGTSIYIPGTVLPMLPRKLSNGICSLNENEERLALAIDIEIDKEGNVVYNNIYKAIIKVVKKMSYEKVYKVITHSDEDVLEEYKEFEKDIFQMRELALILKEKRKKDGSINFDISDTQVVLDENNKVIDIRPYEITIANSMIEEFMLAANMAVAEKFFFLDIPFIYRIHDKPDEEKLRILNEVLTNYKKRIKGIKNIHSKALSTILDEITDEEEKQIISNFMLRTLKLARYSNECSGHFGLAAKYYCHFTSPIRRYPDLFIHRVISDFIEVGNLNEQKTNKYTSQSIIYSKTSSDAEKQSTIIERDFDDLYKAIFMKDKVGMVFDSVVSSIASFGMFVKLNNTIEGMVRFEDLLENDYFIFDESKRILIGKNSGKIFKIGDKLKVKLKKVDVKSKELDFIVIGG